MKKSKDLFSQLHKKAILYGLVDEGGWFPQMLVSRKTAAKYTKLTKISVLSVGSVAKKFLCALVPSWLKLNQSKMNQLCKTNPIFKKPKMNLSHYITSDYEDKSGPLTIKKQSQNKPNQSQFIVSLPGK